MAKYLFESSRGSLGSRQLMQKLREQGFNIGRYKTRRIMREICLFVHQRRSFRVTSKSNPDHAVAPNLVKMNFNPSTLNKIWAGDITYLKTGEGWLYLSVVMDLFSRKIIGWRTSSRMTSALVESSITQAHLLRKPQQGLIFHSDRGSQYTCKSTQNKLKKLKSISSMGDVGACWDNAVVERFFGSLKHEWLHA